MLTGYIKDDIPSWCPEALKKVLNILKEMDVESFEADKYGARGDDIFFMTDNYTTREALEARPEDHQVYADVQFICKGEERFGVKLGTEGLKEVVAYDDQKDIRFFEPTDNYDLIHFKEGMYIVLWPQDVHVPGLDMADGSRQVSKVVGKIKVNLLT